MTAGTYKFNVSIGPKSKTQFSIEVPNDEAQTEYENLEAFGPCAARERLYRSPEYIHMSKRGKVVIRAMFTPYGDVKAY